MPSLDSGQNWYTTCSKSPVASTDPLIKSQTPQPCSPAHLCFSHSHHLPAPQRAQVYPHCREQAQAPPSGEPSFRAQMWSSSGPLTWSEAASGPSHHQLDCHFQVCACTRLPLQAGLPEQSVCADALEDTCRCPSEPCLHSGLLSLGPQVHTVEKWKQGDAFTLTSCGQGTGWGCRTLLSLPPQQP